MRRLSDTSKYLGRGWTEHDKMEDPCAFAGGEGNLAHLAEVDTSRPEGKLHFLPARFSVYCNYGQVNNICKQKEATW